VTEVLPDLAARIFSAMVILHPAYRFSMGMLFAGGGWGID
jgi:hypothetical protein